MGKTHDLLKKAEEERLRREAEQKAQAAVTKTEEPPAVQKTDTKLNLVSYAVWLALFVLIVASIGFNFRLSGMLKSYTNTTSKNEENLQYFTSRLSSLGEELEKAYDQLQVLKEENEVQKAAIENLTKAKNSLFTKARELEAQLVDLKETTPPAPAGVIEVKKK